MITVRAMRAGLYGGLSALAILAAATPAAAQDVAPDASADADSGTQIIVTGSRIARTDADTIQPTLVTTADQIDRRGYTNVAQALSEIAAFGVAGAIVPAGATGVPGYAAGAQTHLQRAAHVAHDRGCQGDLPGRGQGGDGGGDEDRTKTHDELQ